MGVLFPTQSQFPCSVYILTEKPLGSRAVSALPASPPGNGEEEGERERGEEEENDNTEQYSTP